MTIAETLARDARISAIVGRDLVCADPRDDYAVLEWVRVNWGDELMSSFGRTLEGANRIRLDLSLDSGCGYSPNPACHYLPGDYADAAMAAMEGK